MSAPNGTNPPAMPTGMGERGTAFYAYVSATYDLSRSESEILIEVARALDRVDLLHGMIADALDGDDRIKALREARQQQAIVARLLAQLELPDDDGERLATPTQARARRAANVRWARREAG